MEAKCAQPVLENALLCRVGGRIVSKWILFAGKRGDGGFTRLLIFYMFIAEDVNYSNLTWIWVDNAEDSNFIILIVWLGHKGLEYGVALQWLHFLERLQGENVETASRRYNQDCAHDFEEDDLFIEAEAGEDLGVVLMDNGHLLGRKVSCFLDQLTAHD